MRTTSSPSPTRCAETSRGGGGRPAPGGLPVGGPARPRPARPRRGREPGREQARRLGGDGTPEVTRVRGRGSSARGSAARRTRRRADRRRPRPAPPTPATVGPRRGRRGPGLLRPARGTKTRDLTKDEAAYVDAAVAEPADGRIPWSRFEALVEAKVAARRTRGRPREGRTGQQGHVRQEAPHRRPRHGHLHGPRRVATIDAIDAAVTARADQLDETMPEADRRRAPGPRRPAAGQPRRDPETPIADLLPDRAALPAHLRRTPTPTGQIARLEGHGPVTEAWITSVLGPNAGSRSPRSSTSPARLPSTPTRSPTDIDRPCI